MGFRLRAPVAVLVCVSAGAQTIDVGSGAPTPAIQQLFVQAWARNAFNLQVALPPLGNVKKFGSTGYAQEFSQAFIEAEPLGRFIEAGCRG